MNKVEITSYEAACQVNKQDPTLLPDVSMLDPKEGKYLINHLKLTRVVRALNTDQETGEVWEPNWNDHNEWKYFPWFEIKASKKQPGGFGFSRSSYGVWRSITPCGSRLCLDTREKVAHLQKHFEDLLIECYLIIE